MATTRTPAPGADGAAGEVHTVLGALRSPRVLRREVLAGLVVGLALVPEAISFAVIVGVDPRVGLFTSVTMAMSIAVLGGRRAMISSATGAVAFVVAPVMRDHGLDYLLATVLLGGLVQVLLGLAGAARLMRFVPRGVMVGFVNSLAALLLLAQVPHLVGVPWAVYPLVAVGVLVVVGWPRLTRAVPAPLVAIVLLTTVTVLAGLDVPDVGDEGALPSALPVPVLPDVPLTWQTLRIIGPYAVGLALVGLLETLVTADLVDRITDTGSDKRREAAGQGGANLVTGLLGGMGGCAVIGQSVMNTRVNGARTRVSTFSAGALMLVLVLLLGDVVAAIPMAALVAVMLMVAWQSIDRESLTWAGVRSRPVRDTVAMLATLAAVVATHNLLVGLAVGVVVVALLSLPGAVRSRRGR
ncbi:SulP family inorganic anion transporter [uncultured Nocardioides sp.]|uniref:SulP family inorganic anion transporter n=1 Tax=uncultured Nocardioides sp. TaxID=198441 RepID=UPI002601C744|nr:SulP family inorganic anion transporter [uncultured Nocardioides sp.]